MSFSSSSCILPLLFFLAGYTLQMDLITKKKNHEHLHEKNITYFLYFTGLLRERERERERESGRVMCEHSVLTRDPFTSIVSRDLLTFEHDCFYKHIYSRLTTPIRSASQVFSFQLVTRYFLLLGFCQLFP